MNMDVTSGCGGGSGISASLPDEFSPAGLRVLAVDDDAVCLAMLGQTLRQCQYQVTTTNHALKALRILTERKDEFDIVISDVNMPDMSGLELLDIIKVEMDIPVILVSGHSEMELVEKGVERGAVDYLLKPVRMEEMMNIWQHVVRRKKMRDSTSPSLSQRLNVKVEEGGEGGGDGDGREESNGGGEGEEGKKEKKARVVWNEDLHQKFVLAVNRLGYDKAVPKRILDMMNVEGLTRENVASHLQKYRLYLKRMNTEQNLANPLGSEASSSSLSAASLIDGFDEFRSSITPASLPGSLNSLSGLAFGEIPSSGFLQPTCNQVQQQQPFLPTGQNPGFGHVPTMAGLASTSANPPMLLHQLQQHGLGVSSLDQDSFGVGQFFSPSLLDSSRCDAIWEPAAAAVDQLLPNFGSSQFVEQVAHESSSSLLPATTMECNYCMPFSGSQVSSTGFGCMTPESHAGKAGQAGLIGNVIEGLSNTSLNSSFGEVGFQYGCGVDQRRSFDAAGQFSGRVSPSGFEAQNGFAGCGGSFDAVDGTTMAGMTNKEHNNDDHMIFDGVFGSDAYRRLQ